MRDFGAGAYRYIPSEGRPFSAGIAPMTGFDLVHGVFARPVPLVPGIEAVRREVEQAGRPSAAIAGLELRIPRQLTPEGFREFNVRYRELLAAIGVIDGENVPAARTNVVPLGPGVAEPVVVAFTYTVPGARPPLPDHRPFRLAGASEARTGSWLEMARSAFAALEGRMRILGVGWADATRIDLYADRPNSEALQAALAGIEGGTIVGIHWFPSLPPVIGHTIEFDAQSVRSEIRAQGQPHSAQIPAIDTPASPV